MNYKKIIGIIILVIGLALIGYGIHSKRRISAARKDIEKFTKPFSHNPFGKVIEKDIKGKAGQYDTQVMWLFISGAVLVIVGGVVIIFGRKRQ